MKCMRKFCLPKGMSDRVSSSAPSRCMVTSFISIHFTGSVPTHVTANAITKISCQPSSKHSIVTNLAYEVDGLGTIYKFVLSSIQLKFIHHFKKIAYWTHATEIFKLVLLVRLVRYWRGSFTV